MNRSLRYILLAGLSAFVMPTPNTAFSMEIDQSVTFSLRDQIKPQVDLLRIGLFSGNVKAMNQAFTEIDSKISPYIDLPEYSTMCDFDCQVQMISFHLFQANEIQYLTNRENGDFLEPSSLLAHVGDGLVRVNRSISDLTSLSGSQSGEGSFNEFLAKQSRLYELKIQLLMTGGDIWYRSNSQTRLNYLQNQVKEGVGLGEEGEGASNSQQIETYYKQAQWTLAEALLSIPATGDFDKIRFPLEALKQDLERRRNSLKKGFIFLDIDPNVQVVDKLSDIKESLSRDLIRLKEKEADIERRLSEWVEKAGGQAQADIDQQEVTRQNNVSLKTYKVSQYETIASKLISETSGKVDALESDLSDLVRQQTLAELEFQLNIKTAEVEGRLAAIENEKDVLVTNFAQQKNENQINDLRWLMDWDVAQTNLEVQLQSIESELKEFNRQENQNAKEKELKNIELEKLASRIKNSESEIRIIENETQQLEKRQYEELSNRRIALANEVCRIELRLGNLGLANAFSPLSTDGESPYCTQPQWVTDSEYYFQKMCGSDGLREKLNRAEIDNLAKALSCLGDISEVDATLISELQTEQWIESQSCPITNLKGDLSANQLKLISNINAAELELSSKEITNLAEQILRLNFLVNEIENSVGSIVAGRRATFGIIRSLEVALTAATAVPDQEVTMGLAGGLTVEGPSNVVRRVAAVALDIAKDVAEREFSIAEFQLQYGTQMDELRNQMATLMDQIEEKKLQRSSQVLHLSRSAYEIFGQVIDKSGQLRRSLYQNKMDILDCQREGAQLELDKQSTLAEHRRAVAEFNNLAIEEGIFQLQKEQNQERILQAKNEIIISKRDIDGQNIELAALEADAKIIEDLKKLVEKRRETLEALQARVGDKKQDLDEALVTRDEIIEKLQGLNLHGVNLEAASLEKSLGVTKGSIESLTELVDRISAVTDEKLVEQLKIREIEQNLASKVIAERQEIFDIMEKSIAVSKSGEKRQVFFATQAELSELLRGTPELIRQKRRIVENLNLDLALLRSKSSSLLRLVGVNESFDDQSFAYSAAQFETYTDNLERSLKGESGGGQELVTNVVKFRIPNSSALAQELIQKRRALLELSPGANSDTNSYRLWDAAVMSPDPLSGFGQNVAVVDAFIGIENTTGCRASKFEMSHLGWGHFFSQVSDNDTRIDPKFFVGPRRSIQGVLEIGSESDPNNGIAETLGAWDGAWTLTALGNQENASVATRPLGLLGTPVNGAYELKVQSPSGENCKGFDKASFNLYLVISGS